MRRGVGRPHESERFEPPHPVWSQLAARVALADTVSPFGEFLPRRLMRGAAVAMLAVKFFQPCELFLPRVAEGADIPGKAKGVQALNAFRGKFALAPIGTLNRDPEIQRVQLV